MTARIPTSISTLFVERSILALIGNMMPPRDPNDDDDGDEDKRGSTEPDDDLEPAVVREPDE